MLRWDKKGIPHKGWRYLGVEDLGENLQPGESIITETCEMCNHENIRYVHLLEHPDYDGILRVGCDCAEKLTEDYTTPKYVESEHKNRLKRKKNFMKQIWQYKPNNGNYVLRYKGEYITIMPNKFGKGWGVIYNGSQLWTYNGRKILDLETAKNVAFELFDKPRLP